jgi:hypothetical protein
MKGWTEQMAGQERKDQLQALARTENEYGVDPFGFNLDFSLAAVAPMLWLYRKYFRVETFGIEKIPRGRVLLIDEAYALNDGTFGYTLDSSNLIVVDYSNHFNKVQSTVLHEILHAARMTYDNNARPGKKADFNELEHYFIGVWEPTLLQIIKDNPELIKWLTQK